MKQIKFLAAICCVIAFFSCGNASNSNSEDTITVKGGDGTEYESYQECCAVQDFQAAHLFLAKLQNSEKRRHELKEAKEYVFKQEALFLMSIGDETAQKRILYLLKEEGENNAMVDMLIDLAIDKDDADFVMTLAGQYSDEKIDNTKLMSYLISKNSKECSDLVLRNLPIIKLPRPTIGFKTYYGHGGDEPELFDYRNAVSEFNGEVLNILNQAIIHKNQYLAKHVVSKAIPNVEIEEIGFIDDVHYRYNIKNSYHDVNEVNSMYKDALSKGKFN